MKAIESEQDYDDVCARYETIKHAAKDSEEHKEKMLLVRLICEYEKRQWEDNLARLDI